MASKLNFNSNGGRNGSSVTGTKLTREESELCPEGIEEPTSEVPIAAIGLKSSRKNSVDRDPGEIIPIVKVDALPIPAGTLLHLYSCSTSPDGTLFLVGGRDGFSLFRTSDYQLIAQKNAHGLVWKVGFTDDGEFFWTVTTGIVKKWRLSDLSHAQTICVHISKIDLYDHDVFSTGLDGVYITYSLQKDKEKRQKLIKLKESNMTWERNLIAVSEKFIVQVNSREKRLISIWNGQNGNKLTELSSRGDEPARFLEMNRGSTRFAVISDFFVEIWSLELSDVILRLSMKEGDFKMSGKLSNFSFFNNCNRFLTAINNEIVQVWSGKNATLLRQIQFPKLHERLSWTVMSVSAQDRIIDVLLDYNEVASYRFELDTKYLAFFRHCKIIPVISKLKFSLFKELRTFL